MQGHESFLERSARAIYQVFGIVAIPILVVHLLWRSIRQPDYRQSWGDRFLGRGGGRAFADHAHILWVHAVSVGETRAAAPLILQWLARHPDHCVVLTHTTPTGVDTGRQLFAKFLDKDAPPQYRRRVVQCIFPYDFSWAGERFLRWANPSLGVLMETELWPNLLAQADVLKIPMVLVNARLSPRSARRLTQWTWLSRPAVRRLTGIAAQTESDLNGFRQVLDLHSSKTTTTSPKLIVVGNLKFDVSISAEMAKLGESWRSRFASVPIWLAASTRDDEERDLLAAWRSYSDRKSILVIVPRHPQRFDRVARLIEEAGFVCRRRSECKDDTPPECVPDASVILGDSLGEMAAYMKMADLVLMGGSLVPLGGQNPIEACAAGKPVFFGPNMFNFAQIARALVESGAGVSVTSFQHWLTEGQRCLNDPEGYAAQATAAREFADRHRGATMRTLDFIETLSPEAR